MSQEEIVIVGAGIIGLTCAYQLSLKNYTKIKIVAKDFPESGLLKPNYTSSKSGAHYRPFPSKNEFEYRDSKLTRSTYKAFKKLSKLHPETSIKFIKGFDYLEKPEPLYENLGKGYREGIDDFEVIPKNELPKGIKFGASYKTWSVNPHTYMMFMVNALKMKYFVEFIESDVSSLKQVSETFPSAKTIINCTGNGLLFDGTFDPNCYPIRGQTLLVRAPKKSAHKYENATITYQLANGEWCFVIPRPLNGGIIVGGTKVIGSLKATVDTNEKERLVKNALVKFPDLSNDGKTLDIQRVNVGFRPARNGGVRIEKEILSSGLHIIHCYGFGGSGIEMSWGAAEKTVELVSQLKGKF